MPWSSQRWHTPDNWPQLRASILERDGHRCQWKTDDGICGAYAVECDHIRNKAQGGGDQPSNLRALCTWHHDRKSSAEGNAARQRVRMNRATPKHPGLL